MKARTQRLTAQRVRLLHIDPARLSLHDNGATSLPTLLTADDLLVVNDAATLPASLAAQSAQGDTFEVRLARHLGAECWQAVLLGSGDWRTPTERRPAPPRVNVGDTLRLGHGAPTLSAHVMAISSLSPRLLTLHLKTPTASMPLASAAERSAAHWQAIYQHGRPIQYAYAPDALPLASVQSPFAVRPWAMEPPSAGFALNAAALQHLRSRGVQLASLTHGAALSATGDAAIDAALPLPERYDIPAATVAAIAATRARGGRVVALGTTVVRALESAALGGGPLPSGEGLATLRIDADHCPRIVDGVVSGVHLPGDSHFDLLSAFAPAALLKRAADHAEAADYRHHEFGDVYLVLPSARYCQAITGSPPGRCWKQCRPAGKNARRLDTHRA